jgi:hypothetical protein
VVGLATASTAFAQKDVVLWACHGPNGQPLGSGPFGLDPVTFAEGCATPATSFDSGGLRGEGGKPLRLSVPPSLTLSRATISRRTSGLGQEGGGAARYYAKTDEGEVEGSATDLAAAEVTRPASGGWIELGTTAATAGVDVQRVGLRVADTSPPFAAVGGIGSDRRGVMNVAVWAADRGVGLGRVDVLIDGERAATGRYGDESCTDLSPADPQVDLPLGANCPANGALTLPVDTNAYPDGDRKLEIRVYDAAGNEFDPVTDYAFKIVNHPSPGSSTGTLDVGSGNTTQQSGGGRGGRGDVAGETATSCSSPKLSMFLSQEPAKVSNGVPLLTYAKRYRFRGRLTCVVGGKRRSAPRRTRIDLLNTIGRTTHEKGGATVRGDGRITLILAYKSSRTLVFRYTSAGGRRSQVKIRIRVAKDGKG